MAAAPAAPAWSPEAEWPEDLATLVRLQSSGALELAVDEEVGRHLVAAKDLEPNQPVLVEPALLSGSDAGYALSLATLPAACVAMRQAWAQPEGGGINPLAHVDIFCAYSLLREEAAGQGAEAVEAQQRLDRLFRWLCRPEGVNREAQRQKLEMIHQSLRLDLQRLVSLKDLEELDDALARNLEEFTGSMTIQGGAVPSLRHRHFQGIFPCKDLLQHSCAPNVNTVAGIVDDGPDEPGVRPQRFVIEIVPLRPILKGEQLSWNYLPYWKQLWPTQLRRQALSEGWGFFCRCKRCFGAAREEVMAFRCPVCGSEDLCPSAPCAAPGEDPGLSHLEAVRSLKELCCGSCQLQISAEGGHAEYFKRCVEAESALFALPWRKCYGRDLSTAPKELELLSSHHWLRVDQASQELDNAQTILGLEGLDVPGSGLEPLRAAMLRFASCASLAVSALRRLLGQSREMASAALPSLLLSKALFTGKAEDWKACFDSHRAVYGDRRGGQLLLKDLEKLGVDPKPHLATGLGADGLQRELSRTAEWVGDPLQDEGSDGVIAWSIRRLWLCPRYGVLAGDAEEGEEEEDSQAEDLPVEPEEQPQGVEAAPDTEEKGPERATKRARAS